MVCSRVSRVTSAARQAPSVDVMVTWDPLTYQADLHIGVGAEVQARACVLVCVTVRLNLHVGADLLAQVGDLVDEADLGRQERVRRVLGQLGGAAGHDQQARLVAEQRPVDLVPHARPLLGLAPHYPPGGAP